jgi:hypothetical protein
MGLFEKIKGAFARSTPTASRAAHDTDEKGFTPTAKAPSVVAKRFVLLVLVAELADSVVLEGTGARNEAIAARKATFDALLRLGFGPDDLESAERTLALGLRSGRVEPVSVTAATWRLDCAAVLAWALGLRDLIPGESESIELAPLRSLVPFDRDAVSALSFAAADSARSLSELMEQRHAWMMRMLPIMAGPPTETRSRVMERFRALLWLTDPNEDELCTVRVVA